MDLIVVSCLIMAGLLQVRAAPENLTTASRKPEVPQLVVSARSMSAFSGIMSCGLALDLVCFVDKGQDLFTEQKEQILAQADKAAISLGRSHGRQNDTPSELLQTLNKVISQLTSLFRENFTGWFKGARGNDSDEIFDDSDNQQDNVEEKPKDRSLKTASTEARKKKKGKIHKLIDLIKLLILGAVIAVKLGLLLKLFSAALQVKFLLIALAGLLLNAARFYLDLKKGHNPQKVIYYEHAQHQHHYDGGEEDWGNHNSGPEGEWARSYEQKESQDLAYAKQKPSYTPQYVPNGKGNVASSWYGNH